MMIVEYCPFGSLQKYLRANESHFIDQRNPPIKTLNDNTWRQRHHTYDSEDAKLKAKREGIQGESDSKKPALKGNTSHKSLEGCDRSRQFTTSSLVSWVYQIAKGMEYLGSRKVVHRDLATRNILLAEENIVKICDFGLARDIYKDSQYIKKEDGPLPIKWMALESLTQDMVYTSKSDVWAYGITLWEMFSLGKTPYPGMNGAELVRLLQTGYRMEAPRFADHHILGKTPYPGMNGAELVRLLQTGYRMEAPRFADHHM
ncbi:unnamed protein product, partial [Darwinula stevensoni]